MPRKLLVIDQSVRGAGGHYLEYALRVLEAAKSKGMEPVLGAHRAFAGQSSIGFKAFSVFRYTFWENLLREGTLQRIRVAAVRRRREAHKAIILWFQRIYYRFLYSQDGLGYQRAHEIGGFGDPLIEIFASELTQKPTKAWRIRLWRAAIWTVAAVRHFAGKGLKLYARIPRPIRWPIAFTKNLIKGLFRLAGKLLVLAIKILFGLAATPIFLILAPFGAGRGHRSAFRHDLAKLIRDAELKAGDVAFVPTLGETELMAIGDLCARSALARSLSWRLLFRRNMYVGRSSSYSRQNDHLEVRRFRLALHKAASRMRDVDLRVLTDTYLLTEQYNLPKIMTFETAPIPVGTDFSSATTRDPDAYATVAGYFGDARDEKGFPLLSDMLDELYGDYVAPGRLRLVAQSNFNLPGGEPGSVRSRLALSALPPEYCELVEGPFESDEYLSLFSKADVVLIPYDQDNYAARSSGVFAEALAAGKPTVVTRGTWMATVLEPYRQAYLAALRHRLPSPQRNPASRVGVVENIRSRGEPTRGELGLVKGLEGKTHIFFEANFAREERRHHLVVALTYIASDGAIIGTIEETIWLCRPTVRSLTPIPKGSAAVKIALKPLDSRATLLAERVVLECHRLRKDIPSGFGGRIVDPSPFALAEGLRDVIENKASYLRAAAGMSPAWRDFCSADSLLAVVIDRERPCVSPEIHADAVVEQVLREPASPGSRTKASNVIPLRK
jgi:glycosyltransferase involved in cell wall biosynthesis